eukprot:1668440-Lingulodinium_polyedra.AAC.1
MHAELQLFLVIYVDDFKLSGPTGNLAEGWRLLRSGLSIEPEQRYTADGVTYLGCTIERTEFTLPGGQKGTAITYNMEKFVDSCVEAYRELAQ